MVPMNRETRANLIFLVVLLVLMIPGMVIVIRKKLQPGGRAMAMPDAIPHEAAYIDYVMQKPGIRRVTPPTTSAWVIQIATRRWKGAAGEKLTEKQILRGQGSEKHGFEVVALTHRGGSDEVDRAGVVAWDPDLSINPMVAKFSTNGRALKIMAFDQVGIPPEVRHELQAVGFVNPPRLVGWYELGPTDGESDSAARPAAETRPASHASIEVNYESPRGRKSDRWVAPEPAEQNAAATSPSVGERSSEPAKTDGR